MTLMEKDDWENFISTCVEKPSGHTPVPLTTEPKLFSVTTVSRKSDRTPVICTTFARAEEIILSNEGDIFEYYYDLVVIEAVQPDALYSLKFNDERYWYKWDNLKKGYVPIEEPELFGNVVNFGIG
jgi:hypothetical protein